MNPPRILSSRPAALLPPALLLFCLGLWAVDVFIWDEWIIWAHVLEKLNHGLFGLADLAAHWALDRAFVPQMPTETRQTVVRRWAEAVDRSQNWATP